MINTEKQKYIIVANKGEQTTKTEIRTTDYNDVVQEVEKYLKRNYQVNIYDKEAYEYENRNMGIL